MGLFGNSTYKNLKKIVDASATVSKGSMSPAGLMEVMAKQTEIAEVINKAAQDGSISQEQQRELLSTLMAKMGMR